MSKKFVMIRLEYEDNPEENKNIYEATSYDPQVNRNDILKSLYTPVVMGTAFEHTTDIRKGFIECSVNLLHDMVTKASLTPKAYSSEMSQDNIDLEFTKILREMASLLTYMINCSSWRLGELKSFDAMEFKSRLTTIQSYCTYNLNSKKESRKE